MNTSEAKTTSHKIGNLVPNDPKELIEWGKMQKIRKQRIAEIDHELSGKKEIPAKPKPVEPHDVRKVVEEMTSGIQGQITSAVSNQIVGSMEAMENRLMENVTKMVNEALEPILSAKKPGRPKKNKDESPELPETPHGENE